MYVPVLRRKDAVHILVHIYWWCEQSGSCLWVNVSTFFLLGKNGIPEAFSMCIFAKFCQITFQWDCISQPCHREPLEHILNINTGCNPTIENKASVAPKRSHHVTPPSSATGQGGKTNSKTEITPREGAGLSFTDSVQVPCFPPTLVQGRQLTALGLLAMCAARILLGQTRLSGIRLPLVPSGPVHYPEEWFSWDLPAWSSKSSEPFSFAPNSICSLFPKIFLIIDQKVTSGTT